MKLSTKAVVAATLGAYVSTTEATLAALCPGNGEMCFQWGVPPTTGTGADSGSGNLYFQLRAPTSYAWFALGTGSAMRGSSMFVVYRNGNNVTLSTRSSQGHAMPQYQSRSNVRLLAGSGIVNGNLVANVQCTRCSDIDMTSSSKWISAGKSGAAIGSSDTSAQISYHDEKAVFSVDLTKAALTSNANPFLTTETDGSTKPGANGAADEEDDSIILLRAHGIIMAIVFLAGYPVGSTLMPMLGKWLVHAGWQMLSFMGMWIGFALGYIISSRADSFFDDAHMRIGVIVSILMTLQPVLGYLHHNHFRKHGQRGVISHVHMWYGRSLMFLGIVNGGVGLQFASAPPPAVVAYTIIAAVVSVCYLCGIGFGIINKKKKKERQRQQYQQQQRQKLHGRNPSSYEMGLREW